MSAIHHFKVHRYDRFSFTIFIDNWRLMSHSNERFRWAIQMIHPEKFYCLGLVKDVFELPIGISNSNFSMGNIPISDKQRASIDSSLSFTISVILMKLSLIGNCSRNQRSGGEKRRLLTYCSPSIAHTQNFMLILYFILMAS